MYNLNYGERTVFHGYHECSAYERKKVKQGYVRIKEYETWYLYEKQDENGNHLYYEGFSKFDIDGVQPNDRVRQPWGFGGGLRY